MPEYRYTSAHCIPFSVFFLFILFQKPQAALDFITICSYSQKSVAVRFQS